MPSYSEYFIYIQTFAAPFFSDTLTSYMEGKTPEEALTKAVKSCKHPAGVYSAVAYSSADDHHKGKNPIAKWLCNHEIEKERVTKGKGSYMYRGHSPGHFEVDGKTYKVKDPQGGRIVHV